MRQLRYYDKSVKVIVEHPDGGLLSLPASETSLDLPKPCPQVAGKTPLFACDKLLRLVELVATLELDANQEEAPYPEISHRQQHKNVVQRKSNEKTAQQAQSHPPRIRRTHPALDKADRAVGGQNARHSTSFVDATEEGTVDAP